MVMISTGGFGLPIAKGSVFNTAITADTDIFSDDFTPAVTPTTFRIYATFDVAGVLSIRRTKSGVTVTEQLNAGVTLAANAAYIFDIFVEYDESINIRYSVDANCIVLKVLEVQGAIS